MFGEDGFSASGDSGRLLSGYKEVATFRNWELGGQRENWTVVVKKNRVTVDEFLINHSSEPFVVELFFSAKVKGCWKARVSIESDGIGKPLVVRALQAVTVED